MANGQQASARLEALLAERARREDSTIPAASTQPQETTQQKSGFQRFRERVEDINPLFAAAGPLGLVASQIPGVREPTQAFIEQSAFNALGGAPLLAQAGVERLGTATGLVPEGLRKGQSFRSIVTQRQKELQQRAQESPIAATGGRIFGSALNPVTRAVAGTLSSGIAGSSPSLTRALLGGAAGGSGAATIEELPRAQRVAQVASAAQRGGIFGGGVSTILRGAGKLGRLAFQSRIGDTKLADFLVKKFPRALKSNNIDEVNTQNLRLINQSSDDLRNVFRTPENVGKTIRLPKDVTPERLNNLVTASLKNEPEVKQAFNIILRKEVPFNEAAELRGALDQLAKSGRGSIKKAAITDLVDDLNSSINNAGGAPVNLPESVSFNNLFRIFGKDFDLLKNGKKALNILTRKDIPLEEAKDLNTSLKSFGKVFSNKNLVTEVSESQKAQALAGIGGRIKSLISQKLKGQSLKDFNRLNEDLTEALTFKTLGQKLSREPSVDVSELSRVPGQLLQSNLGLGVKGAVLERGALSPGTLAATGGAATTVTPRNLALALGQVARVPISALQTLFTAPEQAE